VTWDDVAEHELKMLQPSKEDKWLVVSVAD